MATPQQQAAARRAELGLAPDPASDAIWARRLSAGTHTYADMEQALWNRAANEGTLTGGSGATGDAGARQDNPTFQQPDRQTTGTAPAPTQSGPTQEDRNLARAVAPTWLTGALLDVFVETWVQTRDSNMALEAVRRAPQYDQTFYGNRREDGSLRYTENQWLATRDAFVETAAEFGVGTLDRSTIEQLFNRDVSAQEFMQGVGGAFQTFAEPGTGVPQNLMTEFLRGFTSSGSAVSAMQTVRQSSAYGDIFRGNRREDGTIRMDEQDWYAYRRGWQRTLASYGLDPEFFDSRGRFVEAVEREVSIAELADRLELGAAQIEQNIPQWQEFYASGYGLELSREAILASFIDPTVERDVLQRRVSAAQIGGEAKVRGFMRSVERAEELARAGVTQTQARDLYATAERQLPALSATTQRYFRGATGIGEFEEASVLQDAGQQNRLTRALQEEQSAFTGRSDVRRGQDGLGLAGLRRRG